MNIFSLAVKGLQHKSMHTSLNIIAAAMGMAMLMAVFLISTGISDGLTRNSGGVDVVAGAKGSPLQLILSTVYHVDVPIANIDMSDFESLQRNPMVKEAIPIVVGDNYKGWRVVGTTPEFLNLYQGKLAEGRVFSQPFQVVAGANAQLKIGEEFAARHGFAADSDDVHDFHLYKVVGKLSPTGTVIDRLLLTPYVSVQQLHAHLDEDEKGGPEAETELAMAHQVTAVLLKVRNHAALMNLPRMINHNQSIQAANPGYELTRLSKSFGVGRDVLNILGLFILSLSILMLFATLASSLIERRHDMAVLRVMGASPLKLFSILTMEGVIVAGAGTLIGILSGHIIAYSVTGLLGSFEGILVRDDLLSPQSFDAVLLMIGCVAGMVAAFPAAISAARTDIAQLLVRG